MPNLTALQQRVRHHIYEHFVAKGHPPTAAQTAAALTIPLPEAEATFVALHDAHAIVLRNVDKTRVRVAHPMSAFPTPFWVTTPRGAWWGNCIWDSLAIPAMLKTDATIETRTGAQGRQVTLKIENGKLSPATGFAHLPLPLREWWHDIDFTCAHILFFDDEAELDAWLRRTGLARGSIVPIQTMWELAQAWYGNRMDPHWQPRAAAESKAILDKLGLQGDFWRLHP